jgi:hypothetical protein
MIQAPSASERRRGDSGSIPMEVKPLVRLIRRTLAHPAHRGCYRGSWLTVTRRAVVPRQRPAVSQRLHVRSSASTPCWNRSWSS